MFILSCRNTSLNLQAVLKSVYSLFKRNVVEWTGSSCVHFRNWHVKILNLNFKINLYTWSDLELFQLWGGMWWLLHQINRVLTIITLKPLTWLYSLYSSMNSLHSNSTQSGHQKTVLQTYILVVKCEYFVVVKPIQ